MQHQKTWEGLLLLCVLIFQTEVLLSRCHPINVRGVQMISCNHRVHAAVGRESEFTLPFSFRETLWQPDKSNIHIQTMMLSAGYSKINQTLVRKVRLLHLQVHFSTISRDCLYLGPVNAKYWQNMPFSCKCHASPTLRLSREITRLSNFKARTIQKF